MYKIKYKNVDVLIRLTDVVVKNTVRCPHVSNQENKFIPLFHYLPSSSWGDNGLVLRGQLITEIEYEIPTIFPPCEGEKEKRKEFHSWNSQVKNNTWKEYTRTSTYVDSLNDKDETRLIVEKNTYWEHPVYGISRSKPTLKDEEKEILYFRKREFLNKNKSNWLSQAYQEWEDENKKYIELALQDGGLFHKEQEDISQAEKKRLEKVREEIIKKQREFKKDCYSVGNPYRKLGAEIKPQESSVFVTLRQRRGEVFEFKTAKELEDFLKLSFKNILTSGKPKPKLILK